MSAAILMEADFSAVEHRVVVMLSVADVIDAIRSRAGVKGNGTAARKSVQVYFTASGDSARPPTLQRYDPRHGGRVITHRGPRNKFTVRRVLVGRAWLQQHMPEEWAALCAARLQGIRIEDHIPTLVRNP